MTYLIIAIAIILIIVLISNNKEKGIASSSKNNPATKYNEKESQRNLEKTERTHHHFTCQEINFINGFGGTINVAIKGLFYRADEDIDIANKLKYGDELHLEKETSNPIDHNAVKVLTSSGNHIGYVPSSLSSSLTSMINSGTELKCVFTKSSGGDIPYQYMEISYKSEKAKQLEDQLISTLEKIGLKETCKSRWCTQHEYSPDCYSETILLTATYIINRSFTINEKFRTINGEEKNIEYKYIQNIGFNNYQEAILLESNGKIYEAIKLYEENIEIGEYLTNSSYRLSVLYKKTKQFQNIVPMITKALSEAKLRNEPETEIDNISKRLHDICNSFQNRPIKSDDDKIKIKKLRQNISNTKNAYQKALNEDKELIANNALKRLKQYKEELEILLKEK